MLGLTQEPEPAGCGSLALKTTKPKEELSILAGRLQGIPFYFAAG